MKIIYFALVTTSLYILSLCNKTVNDNDFSSSNYTKLTPQEKFKKIWSKISEDNKSSGGWYSSFWLFTNKVKPTFEYNSDSMPAGRDKLLNSVGVVGLLDFKAIKNKEVNPYTGVFTGCTYVVTRLSLFKESNNAKKTANDAFDNFVPGLAVKFLRKNVHSGNTVAMYELNGQASWNFFKNDLSNHIPKAKGVWFKAFDFKLSDATSYTNQIGLKDMASYNEEGEDNNGDPKFPFKILFRPTPHVSNMFTDHWTQDFLTQLESLPQDLVIYDVMAIETPSSQPVKIGDLTIREKFTRSKWGDKTLFFKHENMEDDYLIHPEWLDPSILEDPEFKESFQAKYGFEHP